jgi:signal transduction histidine kinase/DNA-binding response OmpR family regulator
MIKRVEIKNYKDIPGVTAGEIKTIEEFKAGRDSLILGSVLSGDAFYSHDTTVKGFSAHLADLLSDIFGIRFVPEIYSWSSLYDGLVLEEIDFTGEFYADFYDTPYFMTTPIASRSVKFLRPKGAPLFSQIRYEKNLTIAFIKDIPSYSDIKQNFDFAHTPVWITDAQSAYALLLSGEIDAIVTDDSTRIPFDIADRINAEDFYPFISIQSSFATYNRDLAPFISVFQKYINAAGSNFEEIVSSMKKQGELDFTHYKLFKKFTPAEIQFIDHHKFDGNYVRVHVARENYPIVFYDEQRKEWRGIAIDILNEIGSYTGLTFLPYEGKFTSNEPEMSVEITADEAEKKYLRTYYPFFFNTFALISKADKEDLDISDVWRSKVGVVNNTPYSTVFTKLFPKHTGLYLFEDYKSLLNALKKGSIDCIMGSHTLHMSLTSFQGQLEVRTNLTFDYPLYSYFTFKNDQQLLHSIINKSQELINLENISNHWDYGIYDYRKKLASAVLPYLILLIITLSSAIIFLIYMLKSRKNVNKTLEETVNQRTRELLEQTRAAEDASKIKSEFLANISHEIRTPLNAIIGLGELELMKKLPKDTYANIEKIFNSGKTLLSIINDVLDISKIESGKVEIINVVYEFASLINDTIHINIVRIGSKPIAFVLDIDESLPVKLSGDELRVKQIINNLLSNAFKYTKFGTVTLSIHREGDMALNKDDIIQLNITVKDTGQGIKAEDIPRLFNKYNQLDTKANRKIEGTGLGLSICRNLVELMGGDIQVESEFGKGSRFTLSIKQKVEDPAPIGYETVENLRKFRTLGQRKSVAQSMVRAYMPYGKVLVVDDVPTNLDVVKGMMLPYGIMMDFALSGVESIEMIKAEKVHYDVIFMDHMMPGMDGIEAVKIIRNDIETKYAKTVPILAFTANALIGNEELFLAHGFQGFLSKPLDPVKLDEALNKWVRNKEKEDRLNVAEESEAASQYSTALLRSDIPGLDIKKGLERFGESSDAYLTVLRSYYTNTSAIIDQLKQIKADTIHEYGINVHGVKSSSYSIGADEVGNMAEQLELAAKSDEYEYISATNILFINKLEELLKNLKVLLDTLDVETPPQTIKPTPDKELLARLAEACKRVDINAIEADISELEKYLYENGNELVVWLREQFEKFEIDDIIYRLSSEGEIQSEAG